MLGVPFRQLAVAGLLLLVRVMVELRQLLHAVVQGVEPVLPLGTGSRRLFCLPRVLGEASVQLVHALPQPPAEALVQRAHAQLKFDVCGHLPAQRLVVLGEAQPGLLQAPEDGRVQGLVLRAALLMPVNRVAQPPIHFLPEAGQPAIQVRHCGPELSVNAAAVFRLPLQRSHELGCHGVHGGRQFRMLRSALGVQGCNGVLQDTDVAEARRRLLTQKPLLLPVYERPLLLEQLLLKF
mmetsp:Transcript_93309/g.278599  ORF Transcript_93309/g.278599 Transcript_93309/m.278599 type:complete len:237 (-) Transcript_93309:58-768(-)